MKILIFSGAGLSQPSGISTFRDSDGLWENHKIEEVCNIRTFEDNYQKVHKFYNQRRKDLKDKLPNKMHEFIATLEKDFEVLNYTQNVDDLLEKAGCKDVKHIHGFLGEDECFKCGKVWKNESDIRKRCGTFCTGKIKPRVVFFYESAPLYSDLDYDLLSLGKEDILIVIGTSGNVFPIGSYIKKLHNKKYKNDKPLIILNNMERTENISEHYVDYKLYGSCEDRIDDISKLIIKKIKLNSKD